MWPASRAFRTAAGLEPSSTANARPERDSPIAIGFYPTRPAQPGTSREFLTLVFFWASCARSIGTRQKGPITAPERSPARVQPPPQPIGEIVLERVERDNVPGLLGLVSER